MAETFENLLKSSKIYVNLCNAMEVFRGREASLESSKGSYRGSRLPLKVARAPTPRNHENLSKFMKI